MSISETRNHILLSTLDNVRTFLSVLTLDPATGQWVSQPLQLGVPACGTASISGVDDIHSDDYFLTTASCLQPTTLSIGTAQADLTTATVPIQLKQSPSFVRI